MRGVILAAGEATRMGNKMFLPIFVNGKWLPLIDYQMLWLYRHVKDVTVIIKPGHPLAYYLRRFQDVKVEYQTCDGGVLEALEIAGKKESLVIACDNVIDFNEGIEHLTKPLALDRWRQVAWTARKVPHVFKSHLDMFNDSFNGLCKGFGNYALTYPCIIKKWQSTRSALFCEPTDIACEISWNHWYDIGTNETYNLYLDEVTSACPK